MQASNFGGTFDQLFLWIFLWNFHRRCLSTSSIPWCKKVKNDQKLKSRGGPALKEWKLLLCRQGLCYIVLFLHDCSCFDATFGQLFTLQPLIFCYSPTLYAHSSSVNKFFSLCVCVGVRECTVWDSGIGPRMASAAHQRSVTSAVTEISLSHKLVVWTRLQICAYRLVQSVMFHWVTGHCAEKHQHQPQGTVMGAGFCQLALLPEKWSANPSKAVQHGRQTQLAAGTESHRHRETIIINKRKSQTQRNHALACDVIWLSVDEC